MLAQFRGRNGTTVCHFLENLVLYISTIQDTAIKSHSIYSLPLLGQFGNVQKCSDDEMETPVYKAVRNSNIDGMDVNVINQCMDVFLMVATYSCCITRFNRLAKISGERRC